MPLPLLAAVRRRTLTRPISDLLTAAGFTITEVDVFYEQGAPKFEGADSLGIAVAT